MCGIVGFWHKGPGRSASSMGEHLSRMAGPLAHRGPDSHGSWLDADRGLGLGHRRLAVVDLSESGHQPMQSGSGRYVLTYNGEIYNFGELRCDLSNRGTRFTGGSDTEVLLAGFDCWGVEATIRRIRGMFAFVVWDRDHRELLLCRDRLGEKPLYYGWSAGILMFGSELKALRAHPSWSPEIDLEAVALYLKYGSVPAPLSIYRGIHKLPPGTFVRLREEVSHVDEAPPVPYWRVEDAVHQQQSFRGSDTEAVDTLERLLAESVARQMVADVPVGAFLSGGIDSSTIVAIMQAQRAEPVRTFSIGFAESRYDEAKHAEAVARHLGTEHTEWIITPEEARSVIPALPAVYDEPFGDSSQIPTILVSRLAREYVTVALSGDGADELFGGYDRYAQGARIWGFVQNTPRPFRVPMAMGLRAVAGLPSGASSRLRHRTRKLADVLRNSSFRDLYDRLLTDWPDPRLGLASSPGTVREIVDLPPESFDDPRLWMMYADTVRYLPDTILTKVDRAAMTASLETRIPMLDHEIVEFAWRLPLDLKIRGSRGKWILRQVLHRYVPESLVDRPKMGFGVPIDEWLRGPLRAWASDLLDPVALEKDGFFAADVVSSRWSEHLSGARDWHYALWPVLMFRSWHDSVASARSADRG
jgi:asparagine synthase (glutamine-hydrolysing)